MKTQAEEVYAYMKRHGSITRLQSIYELGIINTPGRIKDLEYADIKIKRETRRGVAKNGREFNYTVWSLADKPSVESTRHGCEGRNNDLGGDGAGLKLF